jgi:hypothetical protein
LNINTPDSAQEQFSVRRGFPPQYYCAPGTNNDKGRYPRPILGGVYNRILTAAGRKPPGKAFSAPAAYNIVIPGKTQDKGKAGKKTTYLTFFSTFFPPFS